MWGVEERLNNVDVIKASIEVPGGFRVFEIPSRKWFKAGNWHLYIIRKVDIASTIACGKLARRLGAPRYSISGLKDTHAIAYQYASLVDPKVTSSYVDLGNVKAWYLGRSTMIKPGSHQGNLFRLTIKTVNPIRVCENLRVIDRIPSYYGPQRFGIVRPSSHLYGLAVALREPGRLGEEYSYRYPLEEGRNLGYEARALEEAMKQRDPWVILEKAPGIVLEALQAYIFNRALSEAIRRGYIEQLREMILRISYCGETIALPAVRLPSKELYESSTRWARLVKGIAEFEGVNLKLLKNLRPSLRPLYFPFKLRSCNVKNDGTVIITLCLPPGAYATIVLREVLDLNWNSIKV